MVLDLSFPEYEMLPLLFSNRSAANSAAEVISREVIIFEIGARPKDTFDEMLMTQQLVPHDPSYHTRENARS